MSVVPSDLEVGQEVRVYSIQRYAQIEGRIGFVEKVGRKLLTVDIGGLAEVFRMDTQRVNDDYGHLWFKTLPKSLNMNAGRLQWTS